MTDTAPARLASYYQRTLALASTGDLDPADEDRASAADELAAWGLLTGNAEDYRVTAAGRARLKG